ncbi:MAG: hypothetical protein WEB57_11015 [Pseudohongiellaceae bacterium]
MTSSVTIGLRIDNAVPHGNESDTGTVIALWRTVDQFFDGKPFTAQDGVGGRPTDYRISLDASGLLQTFETASAQSGSFSAHQKAFAGNAGLAIDGALEITVQSVNGNLDEEEAYHVATVFLQQLVLAANLKNPGSIQLLGTRFTGQRAHRFEAQQFDSRILYGALKTARYDEWPPIDTSLDFAAIWSWLEQCETSHTGTAIRDANKVLFTLLKVAEQRHEYSARTVLLVLYQLEVLLHCRHASSSGPMHRHMRMILGDIPDAADCFNELYEVRHQLFHGNQPVQRPPMISHNTEAAIREMIGQHNTAVESGTAMVLALLQDLIRHGAQFYAFTETMARR